MDLRSRVVDGLRLSAFVAVSAVVLTANFIGIVAVISGDVSSIGDRVPWYILAASVVFVATILLLDTSGMDGKSIIVTAPIVAVVSFVLVIFGVEGVRHAVENPDSIFFSQVILYFVAAAMVATGLGYWGVRHWREFVGQTEAL